MVEFERNLFHQFHVFLPTVLQWIRSPRTIGISASKKPEITNDFSLLLAFDQQSLTFQIFEQGIFLSDSENVLFFYFYLF